MKSVSCLLFLSLCQGSLGFLSSYDSLRPRTLSLTISVDKPLPDRNGHHHVVNELKEEQEVQEKLAHLTQSLDKQDYAGFVQEMTQSITQNMMDREAKLQHQLEELEQANQGPTKNALKEEIQHLQEQLENEKEANFELQQQVEQSKKHQNELENVRNQSMSLQQLNNKTVRELQERLKSIKEAREKDSKAAADLLARKNDELRHLRHEGQDEVFRIKAHFQKQLEQHDIQLDVLKNKLRQANEMTQEKEFTIIQLQEERESVRKLWGSGLRLMQRRIQNGLRKLVPGRKDAKKKKFEFPIIEEDPDEVNAFKDEVALHKRFQDKAFKDKLQKFLPPPPKRKSSMP